MGVSKVRHLKRLASAILSIAIIVAFVPVNRASASINDYNTEIWVEAGIQYNEEANSKSIIPIEVSVEPSNFRAAVPLNLPVYIDENGQSTVATSAAVENRSSYGAIQIKSITVTGINGWELCSYSDDFRVKKMNEKLFGMSICGEEVSAETGEVECSNIVLYGNDIESITYDIKVPPQLDGLSAEAIANVIVVVGWC